MAVEVSQGICDLCGAPSDASLQECNWLTCTYQHCEGGLYHQECLEKYLKSNKLEKNRKTGFKCPRGCGKGTRFGLACPGRIDKSHPIHPRNEDKKKTKLAAVVVEPQRPPKPPVPAALNCKAAKAKEESKADAAKDAKSAAASKAAPVAIPAMAVATTSASVAGQKAGRKEVVALPPRPEVVTKQKLVELAAQARRELGLPAPNAPIASHGSKGDLQVLATSAAGPSKPVSTAAASAWGKPSTPAAEPLSISPQPPMMSQLPQFQQLLQQASGKKQAGKTATTAVPSPVAQTVSKPAVPVPQPVTPPAPTWPALGMAQTSAAALFSASASSGPSSQTSREATPRPGSPPSAWGSSAVTSASQQQQQSTQQASQQAATSTLLASMVSRPHAGAGVSGLSSTTGSFGNSASSGSIAAAQGFPVTPLAAGMCSAGGSSQPQGPASAVGGGSAASSSGRTTASETQPSSTGACLSAATATLSSASSTRAATQLVGADFIDDDMKEAKLTKAQKKNLKRTEKKKLPTSASADQEQGAGEEAVQEASDTPLRASLDSGDSRHSAGGATGSSLRQSDAAAPSGSGRRSGSNGNIAHQRHASHVSEDPDQAHIAEAEEAAVMEELCINCIVARKVLSLITQLQRLGALEFVAAAAVQRHGSNLLASLEWLLIAGADASNASPDVVLAAAAESAFAAESEIDISDELQQLHDLQAAMGVPTELLQQCVLDCNGDVQTAANTAMERMLSAPTSSGSSAAPGAGLAAVGSSREAGTRMSSGSDSIVTGGQQNGIALQTAFFYSISSLEGAGGAVDSEVTLTQQQQQPKPPPQQPARSSHFGVRLQDEPVGCSGSGYRGGDAITAGFMRGGVVLGASGWPNGYLRDTPSTGFSAGVSNAPGSGTSRSTSRLLHWLGDEAGRPAALEEDQPADLTAGSSLPGILASDPVLDPPFSATHSCGTMRGQTALGETNASTSLAYWLGSNGYHHSIAGPGSIAGSANTAAASAAGGVPGAQDSYNCGGRSGPGNFSFVSVLSKPSLVASQAGTVESRGAYSSRWVSLGTSEGVRQAAASGLFFSGAAAASEPDPPPSHVDSDNDLSSIMALINVR